MHRQTFEEITDKKCKKEYIEWLRLWCENTSSRLPRVALIGDSIVEQVFEDVKKALDGVAIVDFLATSYSIVSPAYTTMVNAFVEDSDYAVVYFNYGLHAPCVSIAEYEAAYRKMVLGLLKKSKVLLGSTTTVNTQNAVVTMKMVGARNACARKIAVELGLLMDDSYAISEEMGASGKNVDGVHFNEGGKARLAKHRAELIKTLLK